MPTKQPSKKSPLKQKKGSSVDTLKKIKKAVAKNTPKPVRRKMNPTKAEIQKGVVNSAAISDEATVYEITMELSLTKSSKKIASKLREKREIAETDRSANADRIVTLSQIVDKKKLQIFYAGSVNVDIFDKDNHSEETIILGVDAVDVELILQLLGLAK